MILGFGTTETDTAKTVLQECYASIKESGKPPEEAIELVRSKYDAKYNKYGEQNAFESPERYSCFWVYITGNLATFTFHHINRRHPLSSDGWAMLKSSWVLNIDTGDTYTEA